MFAYNIYVTKKNTMKVKVFTIDYSKDGFDTYVLGSKTKKHSVIYGSIKVSDCVAKEIHISMRKSQGTNGNITLGEKKNAILQWLCDRDIEFAQNIPIFVRCTKFDKDLKKHIKFLIPFEEV